MEWQPIETAPADGRPILVWGGYHDVPEVVKADGEWWRVAGLKSTPTHWMPLPAPPSDEQV